MIEKFDYDKAKKLLAKKKDKCIVTKGGLPVDILSMNIKGTDYPICGVVKGVTYQFDVYGCCKDSSALDLALDIPQPKIKKPILSPCKKKVKHEFSWHPVSEVPKDLSLPVIFLTDKGRMVTHSELKSRYHDNLFHSYAAYANAVAWVYQNELFKIEDFQEENKIDCSDCDQNPSNCIPSPYCLKSKK